MFAGLTKKVAHAAAAACIRSGLKVAGVCLKWRSFEEEDGRGG